MKLRINESVYEIIYDYTSEEGYEENNNVEQFEGTWTDLQDYLKQMRRNGCYNISANEISDYESVKRADTSRLIESDDKITAKSFQELISKLEDHGYSCEHYYDMKYPESNWLYITKNGDPYEAEFYKYRDGEYELYLHNIHPTKRKNESITRSKRNKLVEKSNFDTVEKAIRYYYPKWYYDDMSVNDIFDRLEKLGHSQDFIDAVIDGITDKYENEEDYGLDDYDECLKEANVVGMGGGWPNLYLPKDAKQYLLGNGFKKVNTELGPCFYMRFTGNEVWEIYVKEEDGAIYVVPEGYDLKQTDSLTLIDDRDYRDDINALISLGNCLSNGEDFDSCIDAFFRGDLRMESIGRRNKYFIS